MKLNKECLTNEVGMPLSQWGIDHISTEHDSIVTMVMLKLLEAWEEGFPADTRISQLSFAN